MPAAEQSTPNSSPALDFKNPPDQKTIDACVHCGFCLATCPSYRVIGKETDSPRGRIYLMNELNKGEIPLSPSTVEHFDSCLGCLACATACPAGVEYGELIAATRPQIERNHPRPWVEKLFRQFLFSTFPYPRRLRLLLRPLAVYQRTGLQSWLRESELLEKLLPQPLVAMESLAPRVTSAAFQDNWSEVIPAQGETRYRVGMILGCVQRVFLPEVNAATIRVLTANGCEVIIPKSQGCCGALSQHQGEEAQARDLARQTMDAFANKNLDAVLINASGCGHTLKEYGQILAEDPDYCDRAQSFADQVQDVQEFLDSVGLTTPLSPLHSEPLAVVYQDACHMLHGQKIQEQPRRLLKQIPDLEIREPADAALCCGSAGIYNILQPEVGDELGRQKARNLCNTKAAVIASANVGCNMQLRKHLALQDQEVPILHPMQLLDYSIRSIALSDGVSGHDQGQ